MKPKHLKLIGYLVVAIMVLNIILFAFRLINEIIFWSVIVVGAVFAYKVLPKINEK